MIKMDHTDRSPKSITSELVFQGKKNGNSRSALEVWKVVKSVTKANTLAWFFLSSSHQLVLETGKFCVLNCPRAGNSHFALLFDALHSWSPHLWCNMLDHS